MPTGGDHYQGDAGEGSITHYKSVYIFAQEKNLGKQLNKDEITDYIINGASEELKLLYEFKVIQIIRTKQVCVGIHFPQLGKQGPEGADERSRIKRDTF